jgi:hypothetical protein
VQEGDALDASHEDFMFRTATVTAGDVATLRDFSRELVGTGDSLPPATYYVSLHTLSMVVDD